VDHSRETKDHITPVLGKMMEARSDAIGPEVTNQTNQPIGRRGGAKGETGSDVDANVTREVFQMGIWRGQEKYIDGPRLFWDTRGARDKS